MLAGHPAAERAPGEREQDQAREQGPQRRRRGERGAAVARRGAAPAAPALTAPAAGALGGAWRAGAGEGGGHEPISAICCSPSATSVSGSGWKPNLLR